MRIAYVCSHYAPLHGGVETHVQQIARRVAAAGHTVEILTESRTTDSPPVERVDDMVIRRFPLVGGALPYGFSPALWLYLKRHRAQFDIIHAHSYHSFTSVGAALSGPIIFTPHYHGTGRRLLGPLLHVPYRFVGGWIMHQSQRILCVSHAEATLVCAHFPNVRDRIRIVPNGIDQAPFERAEPYEAPDTVILGVGRLLPYKGFDRLVMGMEHLPPTYSLVLIGDGPARMDLERLVETRNLRPRVRFAGQVINDELYRWYRTATVCAALSSQEAFGLTVLEGLAAGCGIVASDIAAHREIADLTRTERMAFVSEPATPQAVAAAVQRAEGLRNMPRGALPTWDDAAQSTLADYQDVLGHA